MVPTCNKPNKIKQKLQRALDKLKIHYMTLLQCKDKFSMNVMQLVIFIFLTLIYHSEPYQYPVASDVAYFPPCRLKVSKGIW